MKVLGRIAKLCIGSYILILGTILVIVPSLPLICILLMLKNIEAYVYLHLYQAERIVNYDFLKLANGGSGRNIRTTMLIVNGRITLKDMKELVVTSLVDAHTENGVLCFPQLTKYHVSGVFNNYFVEDAQFNLSDHVVKWGDETVYTMSELQQILVRLKDEKQNPALSPWSLTVIPLQFDKTAIAFRCHPALQDMDLVRNLLGGHKICHHELVDEPLYDSGKLQLLKSLCLSCWSLAETTLNSLKSKSTFLPKDLLRRKVLMWSKPVDSKIFDEMAKHLDVNATEIILGCISSILNGIDFAKYQCPLIITDGSKNLQLKCNAFTLKTNDSDPVSNVIKAKENLRELPWSEKSFDYIFFARIAFWLLPVRFSNYLIRSTDNITVNITVLGEHESSSILGLPIELISVWGEENKETPLDICVTESMGQLVIGTDAYHTHQDLSLQLLLDFEKSVNKLAAETGVFTHYYR